MVVLQDVAEAISAMKGEKNLISKIKFKCTKNHSEIANLYVGGVIPGAVREGIVWGKKVAGKALSLTHSTHCGLFNSVLSSGKYECVMGTLRRSGSAIQNHTPGDPKTTRNYYLYELKLAS